MTEPARASAGHLIRDWRQRRRLSQLDLASEAEISSRHLSFLETGRARPSREMVLHLAERLDIPLRERNAILVAAGHAPMFPERRLDDPALDPVRKAMDVVLRGHEPYPALAIDRQWNLVAMNAVVPMFLTGIEPSLLAPPLNVLRVSLHPQGLAPRIVNLGEWRSHLLERLRRQIELTADAGLVALMAELRDYPAPAPATVSDPYGGVIVPLRMRTEDGVLSFFSTTTVFGTPVDVTVSELALEAFYPADEATAAALRR